MVNSPFFHYYSFRSIVLAGIKWGNDGGKAVESGAGGFAGSPPIRAADPTAD